MGFRVIIVVCYTPKTVEAPIGPILSLRAFDFVVGGREFGGLRPFGVTASAFNQTYGGGPRVWGFGGLAVFGLEARVRRI